METSLEEFERIDGDAQMTMLTPDDRTEEGLPATDEVDDLGNSLRQAVHDEAVQPRMQCLMMDPSFSMVTVQGEDSGIAWETTPSRSTTPWASEAGSGRQEITSPVAMRPVTPGSAAAGRVVVVMDEEQILQKKKSKEKSAGRRSRVEKLKGASFDDGDEVSSRPELVEVSQPNVKVEGAAEGVEGVEPLENKEQRLFCLVSEGSEILNIIVPPKLALVDEEESTVMADNLSYLEETPVTKLKGKKYNNEFESDEEEAIPTQTPVRKQLVLSHTVSPYVMDPPGAPVARPLKGEGTVDYFEKFTLIDAQAPGSPAVDIEEQDEVQTKEAEKIQDIARTVKPQAKNTLMTAGHEKSVGTVGGEIISGELLDEVFYGNTADNIFRSSQYGESGRKVDGTITTKSPLKKSGSALFGSDEDTLTPIFLPDGPPKWIDPALLDEPKAMAFLYTDLYEEAVGVKEKDEDAESVTSEKSFHSRQSDREARGYLEKYILIDETPVVEMGPAEEHKEGGIRDWSKSLYSELPTNTKKTEMPPAEEEITDFFRSCANSSPSDKEPFPPPKEEVVTQPRKKGRAKAKQVNTTVLSVTCYEPFLLGSGEEAEQDLYRATEDISRQPLPRYDVIPKPVAPPRRKVSAAPKTTLDLTPLTPVDAVEEGEVGNGKEQREEEKETASPAETADEGEGEAEDVLALIAKANKASETETAQEDRNTGRAESEVGLAQLEREDFEPQKEGKFETGTVKGATELETTASDSADSAQTEDEAGKGGAGATESAEKGAMEPPPASETEPAKQHGRCVIL